MFELGILTASLLGAAAFGTGDMLGACASRRLSAANVVAISQVAAVATLCMFAVQPQMNGLGAGEVSLALGGGIAHATALMLLYVGLSRGQVGVVAPLCAISSILLPVIGDLALGRQITPPQFAGIGLCVVAAIFITGSVKRTANSRPIGWSARLGLSSGLAYGASDMMLASIPSADTGAVVLVSRCASVALAFALVMIATPQSQSGRERSATPDGPVLAASPLPGGLGITAYLGIWRAGALLAVAAGSADVMGQFAYVYAASRGSMGVASAVTALFPAVTVMLAVVLFAERITRTQMLGYAVATAGVLVLAA
ncbi:MAG: DMT family transporter [Mesorhizobium sp.]|nr:DMT family transporter [Mesorhizobium sp.]